MRKITINLISNETFFYIVLLLIACVVHGQTYLLSVDEKQILSIELNDRLTKHPNNKSLKRIIGDSILISKDILDDRTMPLKSFKEWCIGVDELTAEEADEIFGDNEIFTSKVSKGKLTWSREDFPGFNVALYDWEKKDSRNNVLGKVYTPYCLSMPLVRNDGKFAYIHVSDSDGGVLKIYKNLEGKWILYKTVWLYVT